MTRKTSDPANEELTRVLDGLLERDEDITARAVARLHTTVKDASSITRHDKRRSLLEQYQAKQAEVRKLTSRVRHSGTAAAASKLQFANERIRELEAQSAARAASHLAMIHAMAELGGTAKLQTFYRAYAGIRDTLARSEALPVHMVAEVIPIHLGAASARR